jgi:hypothetical protein
VLGYIDINLNNTSANVFMSNRLLYIMRLAGESPGYASLKSGRSTSVRRHRIEPASGGVYSQNTSLILPPPLSCH